MARWSFGPVESAEAREPAVGGMNAEGAEIAVILVVVVDYDDDGDGDDYDAGVGNNQTDLSHSRV